MGPHSLPAFEISVLVRNALALLSLTSPTVRQLMDRAEASAAARARGVRPSDQRWGAPAEHWGTVRLGQQQQHAELARRRYSGEAPGKSL